MSTKDLIRLDVPVGEPIALAHEFIQNFIAQGKDGALLEAEIFNIVANPPVFFADELRAPLARAIYRPAFTPRAELPLRRLCSDRSAVGGEALPRGAFAPWRQWGEGLETEAVKQMANACALPVAVAGALMPAALCPGASAAVLFRGKNVRRSRNRSTLRPRVPASAAATFFPSCHSISSARPGICR